MRINNGNNENEWPLHRVDAVSCRERDLVIRISNWGDDKDEPGYDVECYIGGVYNWDESRCFTICELGSMEAAKTSALAFVKKQVAKHLP